LQGVSSSSTEAGALSHVPVVPEAVLALEQDADPIESPPQDVLDVQLLEPDPVPLFVVASNFAE